jgi:hypothetical protein
LDAIAKKSKKQESKAKTSQRVTKNKRIEKAKGHEKKKPSRVDNKKPRESKVNIVL